jgi:DNA helicase-2/ATP-dependent DNA helicase PcrA
MLIADLHIHSYLSRATSRNLNLEHLDLWAQLKGIGVLGTGDFTHPQWFAELKEKLEPTEPGLFRLKPEFARAIDHEVPPSCRRSVRFMLSVEISCIYKRHGATRKNHNVIFVPDFESAERLNHRLERIGNIRSDGRPILGLDAHDLLEIVLDVGPDAHFIPAHIWTPWFSMFGSKSGFDTLEGCFGDLSGHIFAVETGLSSDPPMNWRLSALDHMALVSNSDAHSPANLGREANIFDTDLSYFAMFDALTSRDPTRYLGTIEFFPQEGKYHYDGHRKCQTRMSPAETLENGGLCPKCGRPVTVGVMHRVEALADRDEGIRPEGAAPFRSLLTLPDIVAQAKGVGGQSKGVQAEYRHLLERYGPEFTILLELPVEDLEVRGHAIVAEGLRRMREGRVQIKAGYDGEFGSIVLFTPEERPGLSGQKSLISFEPAALVPKGQEQAGLTRRKRNDTARQEMEANEASTLSIRPSMSVPSDSARLFEGLNTQQRRAACHWQTPLLVVAGPGTGKTLTLTRRIAYLIREGLARPEQVLAITFTNRAAEEMRERLALLLGPKTRVRVQTFHALGYDILREQGMLTSDERGVSVFDREASGHLLERVLGDLGLSQNRRAVSETLEDISRAKQNLLAPETCETSDPQFATVYRRYESALEEARALDFDDLVALPVRMLDERGEILRRYQTSFPFVSVDEYQDVNHAQYRMVRLLAPLGKHLCVIGDPHQAIYGFRGADSRYFLRFREDYPDAAVVRLEQNFRSSETILRASALLVNQRLDDEKNRLWSGIDGDRFLSIGEYPTDKAEAESIVHVIERLMGGTSHFSLDSGRVDGTEGAEGRSFADFAVFYRLHAQGTLLEEAFERSGLPYRRFGGQPLAEHGKIRKVLGVLQDRMAPSTVPGPRGDYPLRQNGSVQEADDLEEMVKQIIRSLEFDPDEESLKWLTTHAENWEGETAGFLAHMALASDVDAFDPRAERVTLMTLHASKGLEFPIVFIAGCEANLLPYRAGEKSPEAIEEERRLFYVGLTRAKARVFLTRAQKRTLHGQNRMQEPSPFLAEIEDYLRHVQSTHRALPQKKQAQMDLF